MDGVLSSTSAVGKAMEENLEELLKHHDRPAHELDDVMVGQGKNFEKEALENQYFFERKPFGEFY